MTAKATIVVKPAYLDAFGEPVSDIDLLGEVERVRGVDLLVAASASAIKVQGSKAALLTLKKNIGKFCAFSSAKPFQQYVRRNR